MNDDENDFRPHLHSHGNPRVKVPAAGMGVMGIFAILLSPRVRPFTLAFTGALVAIYVVTYGYETWKSKTTFTQDMKSEAPPQAEIVTTEEGIEDALRRLAGASAELSKAAGQEFEKLNHAAKGSGYIAFVVQDKSPDSKVPVVMGSVFAGWVGDFNQRELCFQGRNGLAMVYRQQRNGRLGPMLNLSGPIQRLGCEQVNSSIKVVSRVTVGA